MQQQRSSPAALPEDSRGGCAAVRTSRTTSRNAVAVQAQRSAERRDPVESDPAEQHVGGEVVATDATQHRKVADREHIGLARCRDSPSVGRCSTSRRSHGRSGGRSWATSSRAAARRCSRWTAPGPGRCACSTAPSGGAHAHGPGDGGVCPLTGRAFAGSVRSGQSTAVDGEACDTPHRVPAGSLAAVVISTAPAAAADRPDHLVEAGRRRHVADAVLDARSTRPSPPTCVYDIDGADDDGPGHRSQAAGRKVLCYVDAGSLELARRRRPLPHRARQGPRWAGPASSGSIPPAGTVVYPRRLLRDCRTKGSTPSTRTTWTATPTPPASRRPPPTNCCSTAGSRTSRTPSAWLFVENDLYDHQVNVRSTSPSRVMPAMAGTRRAGPFVTAGKLVFHVEYKASLRPIRDKPVLQLDPQEPPPRRLPRRLC